eukprot:TRINITY_DN100470_c0_g1_i1.p1 TRINITY_DN100470_c0_g1~~TRINITY_DN100470_c0_g1_i1.p1  ORF type:complete len:218 (+),score=27.94 TRINITY_DN100470_c0_g1_i1:61-714(+)
MSEEDVFLTRHGARIDKEDRSWMSKAGHSRHDDCFLSAGGVLGSQELATKMVEISKTTPVAHVVTSPFYRCVQTASCVAAALDLKVKVEPGICEILSTFPPGFLETEELAKEFPVDTSYTPAVTRSQLRAEYGDGQAARRASQAARSVRSTLVGPILFCGHGASCLGIAEAFGGDGYIGYTSLTRFAKDGGGQWKVVGPFNDVSHLSDQRTSLASAF